MGQADAGKAAVSPVPDRATSAHPIGGASAFRLQPELGHHGHVSWAAQRRCRSDPHPRACPTRVTRPGSAASSPVYDLQASPPGRPPAGAAAMRNRHSVRALNQHLVNRVRGGKDDFDHGGLSLLGRRLFDGGRRGALGGQHLRPPTRSATLHRCLHVPLAKRNSWAHWGFDNVVVAPACLRAECSDALEATRPSALPAARNRGVGPSDLRPPWPTLPYFFGGITTERYWAKKIIELWTSPVLRPSLLPTPNYR